MNPTPDLASEWLETDGLGGFASGTVGLLRTRRYHALLQPALQPPSQRTLLVSGLEVRVCVDGEWVALSAQEYDGEVIHPDGRNRIARFTHEPWPTWEFSLPGGARVIQEFFLPHEKPAIVCSWRLEGAAQPLTLEVRPLLAGRDPHALHVENPVFRFDLAGNVEAGGGPAWQPYENLPAILARSNGTYQHDPQWYRRFLYKEERARGFEHHEDLGSPGILRFELGAAEAWLVLSQGGVDPEVAGGPELRQRELARRQALATPLERAADNYIVRRAEGKTIVAGYPWFGDWGRDTFISLRGLCLATGRLDDAVAILDAWSGFVSEGMLPNRFPDGGEEPEYNTVDAALWYVVAVYEYFAAAAAAGVVIPLPRQRRLRQAVKAILDGYTRGTRHGIRLDDDGLITCGAPGLQLTWMDARVGDWVVTPRRGKPVEIQALWLNALHLAQQDQPRLRTLFERGLASFRSKFWNAETGFLFDVVDAEGQAGVHVETLRPNQLLAVGGLPLTLLEPTQARSVVDACEQQLLTPLGLRSLGPHEPGYAARYEGGPAERDGRYHQGTIWPWLIGPFVEAWLRVHPATAATRQQARERFLAPLQAHLLEAGLGHLSEIADAEAPHTPRGCPFQAWSLAALLWLERRVLVDPKIDTVAASPPTVARRPGRETGSKP